MALQATDTIIKTASGEGDTVWWTATIEPCPWCARRTCPERDAHERFHRASESTWRQAAA